MFKTVGWQPHWLSDGGGGVGVHPPHRNIIEKKYLGGVLYMENTHRNITEIQEKN